MRHDINEGSKDQYGTIGPDGILWSARWRGGGGEAVPSLAVDCLVVTFGHGIAIDSAHGVFRLVAAFELRRASTACLCSSCILCRRSLWFILMACDCSVVKFCLLSLRRAFSCCRSIVVNTLLFERLRALSSCLSSRVKLCRWALWRSRDACRLWARMSEMITYY